MRDTPFTSPEWSSPDAPLVAIDFDDVLCRTNDAIARWHNQKYGTNMSEDTFYYYHYYKNPGWGNLQQTMRKVTEFYEDPQFHDLDVVPGALEGLTQLRRLGYRLVIVTARSDVMKELSENWLADHLPDIFETIHYIGEFDSKHIEPTGEGRQHAAKRKAGKAEVLEQIGALVLVDDALENALQCANYEPYPSPIVLFGEYKWNRRNSGADSHSELHGLGFEEREARGVRWQDEEVPDSALPGNVRRASDWTEAVRLVQEIVEQRRSTQKP